ncbi:MAG TPA: hypothetical protein PLB30_07195 [Thermoleophilia bacterium]|nr:hypothetical protein [Thermoleophilia bacterium]
MGRRYLSVESLQTLAQTAEPSERSEVVAPEKLAPTLPSAVLYAAA